MTTKTQAFPTDFQWGAATAAFQIEGGSTADGRGDSIWDRFCREPGRIANGDDATVATDHYHRWPQDLDLARDMNLTAYRFSVAWPRILPSAGGRVNEKGLAFYDRLVDGMLERGLAPFLTLYHWDLPQYLQDQGGWQHRDTVDHFVDFAQVVGRRLGDRVASIATFNEPSVTALAGYLIGIFPPGRRDMQASLDVTHHQLLAHGRALRALRADGLKAPLGIVCNMGPVHPASHSEADLQAAARHDLLINRLYLEPLLDGRYPERTQELLQARPQLREGDMAEIATPMDFLGVNYYSRFVVDSTAPAPLLAAAPPPGAQLTDGGKEVYHAGLPELLLDTRRRHANLPPIHITESGCAWNDAVVEGRVDDGFRVAYLQGQIAALGQALAAGVDVRGYFVWSLLDNFEWSLGYAKRFGLVHVDYSTLERTVKASGHWYAAFIAQQRSA